jgi:hypothetical protein
VTYLSKVSRSKRTTSRRGKAGSGASEATGSSRAVNAGLLSSRASLLSGLTRDPAMVRRLQLAR